MTDEERKKLCAELRYYGDKDRYIYECIIYRKAADEIERLVEDVKHWKMIANRAYIDPKSLAQSDAEPVAWQYRVKQGGWGGWHDAVPSREEAELCVELGRKASGGHLDDYEIRPLYTAPPRPDVRSDTRKRFDAFAEALDPPLNGPSDYIPIGGAGNGA